MKYDGKYSLTIRLLKERSEDDLMYHDDDGNLRDDFLASLPNDQAREKVKAQSREMSTQRSASEQEQYRQESMSDYVKKWEEYGPELAEINSKKKVRTYRDLKLVLTACTMTDEEIEKRDALMRKAGWVGVFTMAGLKIVKNLLTTVTGLDQVTKWAGVTKDIGETALALVGHAMSDIPPKKAKTNPLSDALTLHHDYSVIIDPELEQDMFRELISILDDMEDEGKLDDTIPASESSFTEYAEQYLEDNVGSPETGIHGADKAGDTSKLTDIEIPKLSKKQEELFYAYVNIPMEILRNAHEIA